MPLIWKPDTCKCVIITDKSGAVIPSFKKNITTVCEDHLELDIKTELYPYVVSENQSANEMYKDWTKEEVSKHTDFIEEYKQNYKYIADPIRDLTPENAKLAYSARRSLNLKRS